MTLLEAAACGLPAVVRRDDAYRDLVKDAYNGYQADSDEELAQMLACIWQGAGELQRLSRNARHLATGHTVEAQADRLEVLYRQLLQQPVGGRS